MQPTRTWLEGILTLQRRVIYYAGLRPGAKIC